MWWIHWYEGAKALKLGAYTMSGMCIEPTALKVKDESQLKDGVAGFVTTNLMTRLTYTLDGVRLAKTGLTFSLFVFCIPKQAIVHVLCVYTIS